MSANSLPIRKFSSKKSLSKTELTEFRNYVSQLKKQGKITGKIEARNARPAFVRGGKTLAEIVNANHTSLKPFQSKRKLPPKLPFQLIDLPFESKSLAGVIREIEANPRKWDYLLEPKDRIAYTIHGTSGKHLYPNLEELIAELSRYQDYGYFHKREPDDTQGNFLKNIQILRWPKGATKAQYTKQRKIRKQLSKEEKKRKNAADAARKRNKRK